MFFLCLQGVLLGENISRCDEAKNKYFNRPYAHTVRSANFGGFTHESCCSCRRLHILLNIGRDAIGFVLPRELGDRNA